MPGVVSLGTIGECAIYLVSRYCKQTGIRGAITLYCLRNALPGYPPRRKVGPKTKGHGRYVSLGLLISQVFCQADPYNSLAFSESLITVW